MGLSFSKTQFIQWMKNIYTITTKYQVGTDENKQGDETVIRSTFPTNPVYVSKFGDDASVTPESSLTPYQTIQAAYDYIALKGASAWNPVLMTPTEFDAPDRNVSVRLGGIYANSSITPTIKQKTRKSYNRVNLDLGAYNDNYREVLYKGKMYFLYTVGGGSVLFRKYDYATKAATPVTITNIATTGYLQSKNTYINDNTFAFMADELKVYWYNLNNEIQSHTQVAATIIESFAKKHINTTNIYAAGIDTGLAKLKIYLASAINTDLSEIIQVDSNGDVLDDYYVDGNYHYFLMRENSTSNLLVRKVVVEKFDSTYSLASDEVIFTILNTDLIIPFGQLRFVMSDANVYLTSKNGTYKFDGNTYNLKSETQMYDIIQTEEYFYASIYNKSTGEFEIRLSESEDIDLLKVGILFEGATSTIKEQFISVDQKKLDVVVRNSVGSLTSDVIELQNWVLDTAANITFTTEGCKLVSVFTDNGLRSRYANQTLTAKYTDLIGFTKSIIDSKFVGTYNIVKNSKYILYNSLSINATVSAGNITNTSFSLFINNQFIFNDSTSDLLYQFFNCTFAGFGQFLFDNPFTNYFRIYDCIFTNPLLENYGTIPMDDVSTIWLKDNLYDAPITITRKGVEYGFDDIKLDGGDTIYQNTNETALFKDKDIDFMLRSYQEDYKIYNSIVNGIGAYNVTYTHSSYTAMKNLQIEIPGEMSFLQDFARKIQETVLTGDVHIENDIKFWEITLTYAEGIEFDYQDIINLRELLTLNTFFEMLINDVVDITGFTPIYDIGSSTQGQIDLSNLSNVEKPFKALKEGSVIRSGQYHFFIYKTSENTLYFKHRTYNAGSNEKHITDPLRNDPNFNNTIGGYLCKVIPDELAANTLNAMYNSNGFTDNKIANYDTFDITVRVFTDFDFEERTL